MEPQPETGLFLPAWPLDDLLPYVSNPEALSGLLEEFSQNERFCTRVARQQISMTEIYGHDQNVFNLQSSAACQALLQILIDANGDLQNLTVAFTPCWEALKAAGSKNQHKLDLDDIDTAILACVGNTPLEKFFAYIAYFRHLLAAAAPKREEQWQNFGANRYLDEVDDMDPPLDTPLAPDRYQPSAKRGQNGAAFQDYLVAIKEKQVAGLRQALNNQRISQETFEQKLLEYDRKNRALTSFDICKMFGGQKITFAKVDQWKKLLNLKITREKYVTIYDYMNNLFLSLFTPKPISARNWLETVCRIQFWFIHIMPYRRGSLAVMNMFRYVMTAYYNYLAHQRNAPMLPIVPARIAYFPDLEALFCCRTEDDFILGSLRTYYCVDFTYYE